MAPTQTVLEAAEAIPLPSRRDTSSHTVPTDEPRPSRPSGPEYLKLISVGFSFFVAGVSDGSIGALLPYVIRQYDISTAIVSSLYVTVEPAFHHAN
jgi:hypothetical protein